MFKRNNTNRFGDFLINEQYKGKLHPDNQLRNKSRGTFKLDLNIALSISIIVIGILLLLK